MLSPEDNEILCRVGSGTPMGELLRRFWLPAVLASELPGPDSDPLRLRILGEDLVAFRDTEGKIGILDAYCPHKLANMYWGRNEECGLRCAYHGWKFDTAGNCVDVANEPDSENLKRKIKIKSYPVIEQGALVWIYMCPRADPPGLPHLEWAHVPADQIHMTRWLQSSNWAQGFEGEIDSSHISFLHRTMDRRGRLPTVSTSRPSDEYWDATPSLTLKETDYGFVYGARRSAGEAEYYWRTTQWYLPMYSMIANDQYPRSGRAWVPVDDHHVITFSYNYDAEKPLSQEIRDIMEAATSFPPRLTQGSFMLPDDAVIDTFLPDAHKGNDYLIDRGIQRTGNYSGIRGLNEQDRAVQESMISVPGLGPGKIVDRSKEYLASADVPVITARRMLVELAKALRDGTEPAIVDNPAAYAVRTISPISETADFETLLREHEGEDQAIVPM